MGLVNQDEYLAASGVNLANTYVKLGTASVQFQVNKWPGQPSMFTASTGMLIYKDADAYMKGCLPIESRNVTYTVPDPSPVYDLLYGSAKVSENWANTVQFSPSANNVNTTGNVDTTGNVNTTGNVDTTGNTTGDV